MKTIITEEMRFRRRVVEYSIKQTKVKKRFLNLIIIKTQLPI